MIKNKNLHDDDDVDVVVIGPDKHSSIPVKSQKLPTGLLCEFVPETVGPHSVLASINNSPIEGSPATIVVEHLKPIDEDLILLEKKPSLQNEKPYDALEEAIKEMKVSV